MVQGAIDILPSKCGEFLLHNCLFNVKLDNADFLEACLKKGYPQHYDVRFKRLCSGKKSSQQLPESIAASAVV